MTMHAAYCGGTSHPGNFRPRIAMAEEDVSAIGIDLGASSRHVWSCALRVTMRISAFKIGRHRSAGTSLLARSTF